MNIKRSGKKKGWRRRAVEGFGTVGGYLWWAPPPLLLQDGLSRKLLSDLRSLMDFEEASKHRHPPIDTLRAPSPLLLHRQNCTSFRSFFRQEQTGPVMRGSNHVNASSKLHLSGHLSSRCRDDSNDEPEYCFRLGRLLHSIKGRGISGRISWWMLIFERTLGV